MGAKPGVQTFDKARGVFDLARAVGQKREIVRGQRHHPAGGDGNFDGGARQFGARKAFTQQRGQVIEVATGVGKLQDNDRNYLFFMDKFETRALHTVAAGGEPAAQFCEQAARGEQQGVGVGDGRGQR